MKIDRHKLTEKLAAGLVEASDSLRSSGINLMRQFSGAGEIALMIENPAETTVNVGFLDCTTANDDLYDTVIKSRFKRSDLFAIFAATQDNKSSSFDAKVTQIDDSRIEVEVKEVFNVSSVQGYGKVYNNGERVNFKQMQMRELIDWMCKIMQCSAVELIDRLDARDRRELFFRTFRQVLDDNGDLKEEYKDADVYELFEKYVDLTNLQLSFMSDFVFRHWPFDSIKRGWTETYTFEVDFSDTIIPLDEETLKRKEIIKDRILSALKENCPFRANFERFNSSLVDTAYETLALGMKQNYIKMDFNQGQFDEETFINALEYKISEDLERVITDCDLRIVLSVFNNAYDTDGCAVWCQIYLSGQYLDNSVIRVDERHVSIDQYLELLAEDRGLNLEENYDALKEEVLETFKVKESFKEEVYLKFELDFSDLFGE